MHHFTDRVTHTTAFVTQVVELNGSNMKVRSDNPSHPERTLLPRSYISLLILKIFMSVLLNEKEWMNECLKTEIWFDSRSKIGTNIVFTFASAITKFGSHTPIDYSRTPV